VSARRAGQASPITEADRQRLLSAVALAGESVSSFWPMRTFIHHNPLHGFEHLPFDTAVRKAQNLTGGRGYLTNEEYRRMLAGGEIGADDLARAIGRLEFAGIDVRGEVVFGGRRVRILDVVAVHVAFGIGALEPAAFRARVREGALRRLFPDLPADRRAGLLAAAGSKTPEGIASELWSAVLRVLEIGGPDPSVLDRLEEAELEERFEREVLAAASGETEAVDAAVASEGLELLAADLDRIGADMTAGEWCGRLAEADIVGVINGEMIKWCSVFLDQGMATWEAPGREKGFYAFWRDLAAWDLSGGFLGIRGLRRTVRGLPDSPEDALIGSLRALVNPDSNWTEYLGRHLGRLPGWAGFVKWRSEAHEYDWQQRHPVDLVHYLAARVFYERHLVDACCRDTWDVEGTVPALADHFRRRPAEYFARRRSAGAPVPDFARRHRPAAGRGPGSDDAWVRFGRILFLVREHAERDPWSALGRDAWRLFRLAQFLALSPAEVRAMSADDARALLAIPDRVAPDTHGRIWLEAHETRYREALLSRLAARHRELLPGSPRPDARPAAQAVFCIDVRSEGFRRHLEAAGGHETFGFAGFFGLPIGFRGFGRREDSSLCPVLIKPKCVVAEQPRAGAERAGERTLRGMAWDGIVHGVVQRLERHFAASYAVVELLGGVFGLSLAGRILAPAATRRLAAKIHHRVVPPAATRLTAEKMTRKEAEELVAGLDRPDRAARLERLGALGFTGEEQAFYIETGLRTMGLTGPFARLVLTCGHGSTSTNNPYSAALECGACGGSRGGPNARVFATLANKPSVRATLRERGVDIPEDTWFVAAQHDTTTDEVEILDECDCPRTHREDLDRLRRDLHEAGARHAQERCGRLPGSPAGPTPRAALRHVERRSADLAQVRPEWGLSSNAAFIVAHRSLTRGLDLGGRVFLHSYDWRRDPRGTALEIIMTAPLIVGEWISMEHYFSTVDNRVYGSDTKVIHNVVGGIGVMLGSGGDIQTGLPLQTVMAGEARYHDPLRLLAVIEAPPGRIGEIIRRHHALQHLFDNGWVNLVALDPLDGSFLRYREGGGWEPSGAGAACRIASAPGRPSQESAAAGNRRR
jgi:uncharacterized protein